MKHFITFFAAVVLLAVLSPTVLAYTFSAVAPSGQTLYYNIVDGNAQVTSQNTSSPYYTTNPTGDLTIPSTVTYNGTTYSVTSIGNSAFSGCTGLTSLTIGNSVTSIGNYAFSACTGLIGTLTIPNSVTSIGERAFIFCRGLTSLTIGNSVDTIGKDAFYECTGLTSLTIGNSVTYIGNSAFYHCTGLTGTLTIPNSVTYIGNRAFVGCAGLTGTLTIPNSVTSIGNSAFSGCTGLTGTLTIPNSVTSIGNSAFYHCTGLTSLTIGNSVTSIGNEAFSGCTGLTSLTIGNSVTSIGNYAFYGCTGLIGTLTIPNSVTSIGNYAFAECTGLTGTLTIGNSVDSIGDYAFYHCSSITSLTIGSSVTSIGIYAFKGCNGLTEVHSLNNIAPVVSTTSFNSHTEVPVYIPCGSLESYNDWDYFFGDIIEDGTPTLSVVSSNNNRGTVQILTYPTCSNPQAVIQASPLSGFRFSHWNDNNTENPRTITVTSNATYTAYFEIIPQYTITVSSANSSMGSTTGGGTYNQGTSVTISATPNSGYRFVRWQDNNTTNPRTITVTGNATYTAYFEANTPTQYTITVNSANTSMGSASGGGTYNQGTSVTISATPNSGYRFVRWQDNNTTNPRTITVTGNATYTAYFESIGGNPSNQYTISVQSFDPTMGSVSGSGTFASGTTTTITATPYPGYVFVQWQDGNTQHIRTITVTGDATYTAYFDYSNGIDDAETADNIKIYSRGNTIVIDFNGQQAGDGRQSVVVYDVMGRVIKQTAGSGQQAAVEIPVTSAGVYIVKVGEQPSRKVVVR
ncbi:MAG: leucine-rich repeat protein [Bacteroidales bacterium]|nr:leucine-rich repeat protein [Bacteroidales bacterium]